MKQEHSLRRKVLLSAGIILLYITARALPMPWVYREAAEEATGGLFAWMRLTMGTDAQAGTFLALGLTPMISASIILQLSGAYAGKKRRHWSAMEQKRRVRRLALGIGVLQAAMMVPSMRFREGNLSPYALYVLTVFSLVCGTFLVIALAQWNEKSGIGGTAPLILVNMTGNTGLRILHACAEGRLLQNPSRDLPVIFCTVFIVAVTVVLEKAEMRLPVRRVMIHNAFAGDDYIAIRLNPAGTMPAMYAMMLFSLPQRLAQTAMRVFPETKTLPFIAGTLNLDTYAGIVLFMVLMPALSLLLSRLMLAPERMAEDMQKAGDYIDAVRAGRDTARYLSVRIRVLSLVSGTVMCVLICVPQIYRLYARMESLLLLTPVSVMMLTGIILRLLEEVRAEVLLGDYVPFLP